MNDTLLEYANELYESLSAEVLQKLKKYEKKMTVPIGFKLVTQGIRPGHLIIVDKGSVEISISSGSQSMFLGVAGQGKVLGLRSTVGEALPEINVTTLEQCEITLIPDVAFIGVVKEHAEMYLAIAKVLSGDLKTAEVILREIPSSRQRRCAPGA